MQFSRRKKRYITLSIAPLVDIVFLLLIFFLLSSSYIQPSIKLNLPEAKNQNIATKQEMIEDLTLLRLKNMEKLL